MARYVIGVVSFGLFSVSLILASGWIMSDRGWDARERFFRRIGNWLNPKPIRFMDRDGNEVVIWGPPYKM
jgi:hypothetical protein